MRISSLFTRPASRTVPGPVAQPVPAPAFGTPDATLPLAAITTSTLDEIKAALDQPTGYEVDHAPHLIRDLAHYLEAKRARRANQAVVDLVHDILLNATPADLDTFRETAIDLYWSLPPRGRTGLLYTVQRAGNRAQLQFWTRFVVDTRPDRTMVA